MQARACMPGFQESKESCCMGKWLACVQLAEDEDVL